MASETTSHELPQALPPELRPSVDHLVTEDDTPVDNIFSEKQQRLLTEPLYSSPDRWAEERNFVALANVGLFYAVRQPPYVPDMLLSLDVEVPADLWPKANRSYFVWEYGKPPDVVVEVVSNNEGGEATGKLAGYARIGIGYYVIYDPERILSEEVLTGFRLDGTTYRRLDEPLWLPDLGLGLGVWQGSFEKHENTWLRWIDPQGNLIPTGAERSAHERERAEQEHARAEQEHARAEQQLARANQERARADQERKHADQQRARAEQLAEQLRRLGAEPDA